MSEKKDEKKTDQSEDPELDDLLDNALEDFDKKPKLEAEKDESSTAACSSQTRTSQEPISVDEAWSQDFIKHAADQFEKNLQNLMQNGGDTELGASFQKMAQTVASTITEGDHPEAVSADFQSAISQALKDLSATQENIQPPGGDFVEADLAAMLEQTSMDEGAGEFLPFMQGMMQSLLSKEVLYPSLKDLVEKYPKWLEEKKETLPPADLERYTKQLELMQKVCTELETEKEDDGDDVKKHRFEKTLMLMQEMQTCGHPPDELIGDQQTLFQSDPSGNPMVPPLPLVADPQNCCVM
ncbi:peroxisomal biogenesis factor 19 [Belonocnema kinseyi]|uniref:peroxisomal biogenesis factor 19 n=1 Tax=Belonocnema kinseyi TaxID=2817044 RepID=UPI00143D4478|nr:peroxisomal biogenesis factor 19 [Belonocnema kinseyi]